MSSETDETEFDFDDEEQVDETLSMEREFRGVIQETFAPHTKSFQYRYDHPDGDLPNETNGRGSPPVQDPHNDGNQIYKSFGMELLAKFLRRAAARDHAIANHPQALAHFLTHIREWEKWEVGEPEPDFSEVDSRPRRELFKWYAGFDQDTDAERKEARDRRTRMLRPGGTGIVLHGEQGTTKTTAMYWLIANIMEVNQQENVIWQSTLDDTEWQVFGPWATMCLPTGVEVEILANPHSREYRDVGTVPLEPTDIARQVIRYDGPEDLLLTMADRQPGQFYVVYPDPHFRQCQALTGYSYENIWDVDDSTEATRLDHYWFALMNALHGTAEYNYWTTIVGDEAHKWLRHGKGNDEHDWWNKIEQWATYWGDARKERLSAILAIHKWHELDSKVRDKIRWGATMGGEEFPPPCPLDGRNRGQGLGELVVWNNQKWNHTGYFDLKRKFSVPGDIEVAYPGFEAVKDAKS